MPHNVIEYSSDLDSKIDIKNLSKEIHRIVIDSGEFTPAAVKTRSKSYDNYIHDEDCKTTSFIHVTTSILTGRAIEIRKNLSDEIFAKIKSIAPSNASVSVNIHEMVKDTYNK